MDENNIDGQVQFQTVGKGGDDVSACTPDNQGKTGQRLFWKKGTCLCRVSLSPREMWTVSHPGPAGGSITLLTGLCSTSDEIFAQSPFPHAWTRRGQEKEGC